MLLGIDHVVIAVHDPDAAAALVATEVGLVAGGGGRHPRYGTFNRLVWLGDAYLELMGVADMSLARGRGVGAGTVEVLERGDEGVASFAIASDSIESDVARLRAAGAPYDEPLPGERERPDGETVRWTTALPARLGPNGLPFLIEHRYEGAEWGAAARAQRATIVQPFGGIAALARLEIRVEDPAAAAGRHGAGLGLAVTSGGADSVGLSVGTQVVRFVRRSSGAPGASIVIAGTAGRSRSVDILGCRFVVEVSKIALERG